MGGVQDLMGERYGAYLESLGGEEYRRKVFDYIDREDSPRPVAYQLDLLRRVGFSEVDLLHKSSRSAAFGGKKGYPYVLQVWKIVLKSTGVREKFLDNLRGGFGEQTLPAPRISGAPSQKRLGLLLSAGRSIGQVCLPYLYASLRWLTRSIKTVSFRTELYRPKPFLDVF